MTPSPSPFRLPVDPPRQHLQRSPAVSHWGIRHVHRSTRRKQLPPGRGDHRAIWAGAAAGATAGASSSENGARLGAARGTFQDNREPLDRACSTPELEQRLVANSARHAARAGKNEGAIALFHHPAMGKRLAPCRASLSLSRRDLLSGSRWDPNM